jgi:SMP-30/Gluconolactonase/LRE-like region
MTKFCSRSVLLAAVLLLSFNASAWDRGDVERFATLPAGAPNPEGIAADRHGNIYASGFDPIHSAGPGHVFVFDEQSQLVRTLRPAGTSNALLGMGFNAKGELLVIDFGQGKVFRVNPRSGAAVLFTSVPGNASTTPGFGLNALTFDHSGNVYISDSFQGVIWKTGPQGGPATEWKRDPLLTTSGFPPFGANGLQFNSDESALFVANTGNDTVVRIENIGGVAGNAGVFTNSINGADGLMIDEDDNIWVCANQADEIVVIDKTGKVIAKIGDFNGVSNGSPVGFLFPASLVRSGDSVYVTNLSLDLRPITGQQSVESQWAAMVTRNTLSRIPAALPR